ncbi:MAG: ABC transporter ATP-binding protein [Granulosicoccus sp.]
MHAVEYKHIKKTYGNVPVMEDVSFTIGEGKFVVLLGPSGCGKTTLLRMTAGLESVTDGDILFSGNRINTVHPRDRDIAMVFQSYALYPQMSVYDNIAFSLQVRKEPKSVVEERVREAADILDLGDYLDRYPKALSGGQRQRVAMGRALVRHPKVFLFDEPLSNLDAKLRAQMRYEIRRIHDSLNTTTIYVTHDQIEAMTMADEIVVMRHGVIEQMGSPEQVYDCPANAFVADFIGSPAINFIPAVVESANAAQLNIGEQTIDLNAACTAAAGTALTVGLRPLDIQIHSDGDYSGKVEFVESTGAETHVHILFSGHRVRAVSPTRLSCKKDENIRFSIDRQKIHLFDASSEMRIN